MRRTNTMAQVLVLTGALLSTLCTPAAARAQDPQKPYPPELYQTQPPAETQEPATPQDFQPFTAEQLDNLVAPIALYADPLLAQVLLAATFPDEIADAAKYVRTNGTEGIDEQAWDVSVKAVAHYPTVLNLMDTKSDWTTSLGQAYAAQSTDVMRAVQRMRRMAYAQGNLVSSPEQEVLANDDYIRVWPANPRYIYVPVYDPAVVYLRPVFVRPGFHAFFSFGLPFRIGPWLIYDWDWPAWRIYYTGWMGGGWIGRSRPFVSITNVYYVNSMHRRVWYGRDVLRRHPDYGRIHRYDALHPGLRYPGEGLHRASSRPGDDSPRRAMPRGGPGGPPSVTAPRPLPMSTGPAGEVPARAPRQGGPTIDRPRSTPVQSPPTRQLPRPVPVERQPTVDVPRSAPVPRQPSAEVPRWTPPQRQPTVDAPRSAPVPRQPAPEVPRWTPPQPSVERPRPAPVESRPQTYERPQSYERPQTVQRPQSYDRPQSYQRPQTVERPQTYQRPQTVERPRVESRPAASPRTEQPRVEQRPQAQGGGGGETRARPREHH